MNCSEALSLQAAIEKVSGHTVELISVMMRETNLLAANVTSESIELTETKTRLIAARDQALGRLREMSAVCQPSPEEWRALSELQEMDTELTLAILDNLVAAQPEKLELRYLGPWL